MASKRRNNGRSKKNCGHVRAVRCVNCGRCVPKDKAIKRFNVRNMVDIGSRNDIRENSIIEGYNIPKTYIKQIHCISCAIHSRIIRSRAKEDRKIRHVSHQSHLLMKKKI